MLEFSPQSVVALGYVDANSHAEFARWWHAQKVLAPLGRAELESLLALGSQIAPSIGVEDNASDRLYLLAAATWLAPNPSVEIFLLMTDILFENRSGPKRLERLIDLARPVTR